MKNYQISTCQDFHLASWEYWVKNPQSCVDEDTYPLRFDNF